MTPLVRKSGGRLETLGAHGRARRVGPFVDVAGTTAIGPAGRLGAPGDACARPLFSLARIEDALHAVGAEMRRVARTHARVMSPAGHGGGCGRAHGAVLAGIDPVTRGAACSLIRPGIGVGTEADAIVRAPHGTIALRGSLSGSSRIVDLAAAVFIPQPEVEENAVGFRRSARHA